MTFTVAVHVAHEPKALSVLSVYVVVVVGFTAMLVLLRFGYMKFNPVMLGVIVANTALLYEALRIAVCPGMIGAAFVVSVHAAGILFTTWSTHVHVADSILLLIIIVKV